MSVDVLLMTSTITNSACMHKRDRRKKSRLKRWSRLPRVRRVLQNELTVLPTRKTLTYAEAQKFVDVLSGGQIHRLNISDSVGIETLQHVFDEIAKEQGDDDYKTYSPAKNKITIICKSTEPPGIVQSKKCVPFKLSQAYLRCFEKTSEEFDAEVEYDVDEEDIAWLKLLNDHRKTSKLQSICLNDLEIVLDRLEKEAHSLTTSSSFHPEQDQNAGEATNGNSSIKNCCVCHKASKTATNSILVCDSCGVSVHQDCYGVPYYPGEQWLCRKCLKSPNSPVKCCLCPCPWEDKNGPIPMKQTNDGKWVHMVCALFIPEISFVSNVYLEPVKGVDKVPKWRHELKCNGCNKSNEGVCLSCQVPSCTNSFHAPCALQNECTVGAVDSSAGRPELVTPITSKRISSRRSRIFFCPEHSRSTSIEGREIFNELENGDLNFSLALSSDADASLLNSHDNDSSHTSINKSSAKKQKPDKRSRRSNQLNNSTVHNFNPLVPMTIPNLSQDSLANISSHLPVRDRQQVMLRIHRYWLLKRHSRQGLPLIQRLHQVLLIHHMSSRSGLPSIDEESLTSLKKLRQDFEKVRLLLELIRKRERLKAEVLKMKEMAMELMLQPFNRLLRHTLEQLKSKDTIGLFHYPVMEEEAPGYRSIIERPVDYSTMSSKIDHHQYQSIDDFLNDFELIISNCLEFNGSESPLYKIALKHRKQCSIILESAKRMCERAKFCPITGLHADPTSPLAGIIGTTHDQKPEDGSVDNDATDVDLKLDKDEMEELKSKLRDLHNRLDVLNVIKTKGVFHQVKNLRKEISLTKRRLTFIQHHQDDATSHHLPTSDLDSCSKISEKTITLDGKTIKRDIHRSPEDEFTQSDSTILEKFFDDDTSSQKRPRLSSNDMDVLSASSLSSATVIAECPISPHLNDLPDVLPNKLRSASRRNRLVSKTNIVDHRSNKTHSTPESIDKMKVTNSLLCRRSSFISPVRRDGGEIVVADENKEPPPMDDSSVSRMMLRSSVHPVVDIKDIRQINNRRCKNNSVAINKRDEIVGHPRISNVLQVSRITRSTLKSATLMEVGEVADPEKRAECHEQNKPTRRATRSNSTLSQTSLHTAEPFDTSTKCINDKSGEVKLSPATEKSLTGTLLDKSKSDGKSSEEIDSSYESSYSLDSVDNSRKESTSVINEASSSNQSLNCNDVRNLTETCLNREQILHDLEAKGMDKNEKVSRSSGSTCSKEVDDLRTPFSPGDVAWAKTKGYPWYPALIITPPCEPAGVPSSYFQDLNPPEVVSSLKSKFNVPVHLVRFFDKRKNWQWLPRSKLDEIGSDEKADKDKVGQVRRSNRRDIKRAYDAAIHHRKTNLRKFLGRVAGRLKEKKRGIRLREKSSKMGHNRNHVGDQMHESLSDVSIDSVLNTQGTTEGAEEPPQTSAGSSADSQQTVLNCSQQFFNPSFHSEKLNHEIGSGLNLVMLSCSL